MAPSRGPNPSARKVTDEQITQALAEHNGHRARAALALGITERPLYARLARMKAEGNLAEGVYETQPEHHTIRGVSSLIGADGEVKAQWVKTRVDEDARVRALLDAVQQAMTGVPRADKIPAPRGGAADLLTVYPLGDPHVGMYSWQEETGEDFDSDIAERDLVAATRHLVACAPPSHEALIVNLGDFFHADSLDNQTRQSHNKLDVDTRWTKVLRVGLRVMRTIIETALTKHRTVRVINEIGNHDEHTSQMLTLALASMYEKNPRVSFDESPAKFHYYRFGKNFIGVHHGDTVKPDALGEIMAADRPTEWGETKFRYWLTGHVHHKRMFELPGCTVESFRTLAAKDAWHAGMGYRSGRDMNALVLHRDYGEVCRHRVDVAMLAGGKK
jgi:Bacterial regulatory protein, Fis family